MRAIEDIHDDRELNRKNRQRGKNMEEALIKWVELTGPAAVDRDLLAFLRREAALQDQFVLVDWQASLAELCSDQLTHGLPLHRLEISTFREMSRQARNAEEALIVCLFACAAGATASGRVPLAKVSWPDDFALGDLLARLHKGPYWVGTIARSCLAWLDAEGQFLSEVNLKRVNFKGANLKDANFDGTDLSGGCLADADLSETWFLEADLSGADLRRANLQNSFLVGTKLLKADLKDSLLTRVYLESADLRGARLDQARGLEDVASWKNATIERKWVERLGLDAEDLNLTMVDDLDPE